MTIGGVDETILDGQLGTVAIIQGRHAIVVGCSSAGTANTCKNYPGNAVAALTTDYGTGPGPQMTSRLLAKGFSAAFCKAAQTTAGASSAVTTVATGTSVVTVTVATARDTFRVKLRVIRGCTIGVAGGVIQTSLDNGETWAAPVSLGTANTYAVPNTGTTVGFAAGTLVAGDYFTYTTTEPKWGASDLAAALVAAIGSGISWDFIQVTGSCSATEAATVKTKLDGLELSKKYTAAMVETVRAGATTDATWQAALIADWATFTSKRMLVGAGEARTFSPIDQSIYLRPATWQACERAVAVDPAKYELGRVKDDGFGGPLDCSIFDSTGNAVCHNEFVQPGLANDPDNPPAIAALGFMTLRTLPEKGTSVYITEATMFSPIGSDFSTFRLRRDMDIACAVTDSILTDELQDTPPMNPDGTIEEEYAVSVEEALKSALDEELVETGRVSRVRAILHRDDNLLSTKRENVDIRIQPRGEVKWISETIGFAATLPEEV